MLSRPVFLLTGGRVPAPTPSYCTTIVTVFDCAVAPPAADATCAKAAKPAAKISQDVRPDTQNIGRDVSVNLEPGAQSPECPQPFLCHIAVGIAARRLQPRNSTRIAAHCNNP